MLLPAINPHKIKVCIHPVRTHGRVRQPRHYVELELEQVPSYSNTDVSAALENPVSLGEEISSVLGNREIECSDVNYDLIGPYLSESEYMSCQLPKSLLWPYNYVRKYVSTCEKGHGPCRISTKSFGDLVSNFDDWAKNDFFFQLWYPPRTHADFFDRFLLEFSTAHRSSAIVSIHCALGFGA